MSRLIRYKSLLLVFSGMILPACSSLKTDETLKNAPKISLITGSKLPAADGSIQLAPEHKDDVKIRLEVNHLALPRKVEPFAKTYMVWEQPLTVNAKPQSLGALHVDRDLSGHLVTETPLKNFEIFVTAERSAKVKNPKGDKLLWKSIRR